MSIVSIQPVAGSSNIIGAGYDGATSTLAIQFRGGAVHHYVGVSSDLYEGFNAADSRGKFFHANIRDQFDSARVDDQGEPV